MSTPHRRSPDEPEVAKLLVRRDQTVEFQGIRYGFLSTGKERTRYCPILPPAQLTEDMLIGADSVTGQ
jgi:hypothetical protein